MFIRLLEKGGGVKNKRPRKGLIADEGGTDLRVEYVFFFFCIKRVELGSDWDKKESGIQGCYHSNRGFFLWGSTHAIRGAGVGWGNERSAYCVAIDTRCHP